MSRGTISGLSRRAVHVWQRAVSRDQNSCSASSGARCAMICDIPAAAQSSADSDRLRALCACDPVPCLSDVISDGRSCTAALSDCCWASRLILTAHNLSATQSAQCRSAPIGVHDCDPQRTSTTTIALRSRAKRPVNRLSTKQLDVHQKASAAKQKEGVFCRRKDPKIKRSKDVCEAKRQLPFIIIDAMGVPLRSLFVSGVTVVGNPRSQPLRFNKQHQKRGFHCIQATQRTMTCVECCIRAQGMRKQKMYT